MILLQKKPLFRPLVFGVFVLALLVFNACKKDSLPAQKSGEKQITTLLLTVNEKDYPVTFTDQAATINLPAGSDTNGIAVKRLEISTKAQSDVQVGNTLSLADGKARITITAEDGTTTTYTLDFVVAPSSAKAIDALVVTAAGQDFSVSFTDQKATVTLPAGSDTDQIALKNLTLSAKATSSVAPGATLSLKDGKAEITVTAEDGSTATYTIDFVVATGTEKKLETLVLTAAGKDYTLSFSEGAATLSLPAGTDTDDITLKTIVVSPNATVTLQAGSKLSPKDGKVEVTVTAEDGSTATYTINIEVKPVSNARYKLTFAATWSAATHPVQAPSNPHFSGIIGMTHNAKIKLFEVGTSATQGIENMSETGSKSPLNSEIEAWISAGTAHQMISGGGIGPSPGKVSVSFSIASTHPLVSVVSMIAPSPDWFIAVNDIDLFPEEAWVDKLTVNVRTYDAGTDAGSSFNSANQDQKGGKIHLITSPPLAVEGVVRPLGTMTFEKIE